MDPFTLALLGAGAVVGGAQAISGAIKSPMEKKNEQELARLERLRRKGGLGLTPQEQQMYESRFLDPQRAAVAATERQNERRLAASGTSSGAQLANLREESAEQLGKAQQATAGAIREADVAKQLAQRAEIQQREAAAEEGRAYRRGEVFSGLGQIAGAVGQAAGTVPEAFRMAGVAGAPIRDPQRLNQYLTNLNVPPESIALINSIPPSQLTMRLQQVANGDLSSPENRALKQALDLDAISRADAELLLGASAGWGG